MLAVGFAAMFGSIGYIAPAMVVSARARGRQAALAADLPDALDLLAVSVEAGLGFDGALTKLTEHMHGPLAAEFELALGEMRIGESRADALKKLAERAAHPRCRRSCARSSRRTSSERLSAGSCAYRRPTRG